MEGGRKKEKKVRKEKKGRKEGRKEGWREGVYVTTFYPGLYSYGCDTVQSRFKLETFPHFFLWPFLQVCASAVSHCSAHTSTAHKGFLH
jgi:hypothetical protein